jgi:hypothetical protein
MKYRSGLAGLLFVAAVTSVLPGSPATAAGGPPATAPIASNTQLRPGDVVRARGIVLIVPQPGQGVWGAALEASGGWRSLGVETAIDGSVQVLGGTTPPPPAAPSAPSGACNDGAYSLYPDTWSTTYRWWFNISSTPDEVEQGNAKSALRGAVQNITKVNNNCGLADRVTAKGAYQGTTTRGTNIGKDSSCTSSDGKSVVGFGNLLSTDLGFTCWWTSGNHTVEADLRLNKVEYTWVVNIGGHCVTKFSIEAVATHEVGHIYGLGHVNEALHGWLTMSPVILPCQASETTLGLGDVRGLEAQY